jgi:hypothetical protein
MIIADGLSEALRALQLEPLLSPATARTLDPQLLWRDGLHQSRKSSCVIDGLYWHERWFDT